MQAKQTGVGFTKKFHVFSPLLLVVYLFVVLSFSFFGHAPAAYADCATGIQGTNGNPDRPDPNKCYDETTNAVVGDATGTTDPNASGADDNKNGTDAVDDTTTNCAVEKIGWFVCPVMEQASKLSDKAFDILADNFLRTEPQLLSDKSGTKVAWEIARNIANIMFIIAFLIIIVSQVTSMGISNYGIKRMIPRLLVAAVAVNASYYICQLVVDVTNILGYEIQNALVGIANSIGPSVFGNASQYGVVNTAHEGWGNFMEYIVLAALATAAIVWLVMGPMVAVIMMVLITVITIIVILLLRKALIVLLIVISPIAIVMYLLPNTEKFFSKWMSMFGKILMVFPVIGLLFGAGQLASTIVLVAGAYQSDAAAEAAEQCNPETRQAKEDYKDGKSGQKPGLYDYCGMKGVTVEGTKDGDLNCGSGVAIGGVNKGANGCRKTASLILGLVAMGIAVAPLIAVWSVLKGALAAAGSMGGKITAGITKGAGNMTKRAEAADQARQNRMALRGMQARGGPVGGMYRRRAKRDAVRAGVEKQLGIEQGMYLTGEKRGDSSFQNKLAGGTGLRSAEQSAVDRVRAGAEAEHAAAEQEEMKAILARANSEGWSNDDFEKLAQGQAAQGLQGGIAQKAAIMKAAQEADVGTLDKAMTHAIANGGTQAGREMQKYIAEAINANFSGVKAKAAYMTDGNLLSSLRTGQGAGGGAISANDVTAALDKSMGSMGEELLASQKGYTLDKLTSHMAANPGSVNAQTLRKTAANLRTDGNFATQFAKMGADSKTKIQNW